MKLVPYQHPAYRWKKVCKHIFCVGERWWEVLGTRIEVWNADWHTLRVAGCFNGESGYLAAGAHERALDVVERYHQLWLDAAERACAEAQASGRISPTEQRGRSRYVGDNGVTVLVANPSQLVTCFRAGLLHRQRADASAITARADLLARAQVPTGWADRAAVRRQKWRASLNQRARRPGRSEEPDDDR